MAVGIRSISPRWGEKNTEARRRRRIRGAAPVLSARRASPGLDGAAGEEFPGFGRRGWRFSANCGIYWGAPRRGGPLGAPLAATFSWLVLA